MYYCIDVNNKCLFDINGLKIYFIPSLLFYQYKTGKKKLAGEPKRSGRILRYDSNMVIICFKVNGKKLPSNGM